MVDEGAEGVSVGKDEMAGWLKELGPITEELRWVAVKVDILYERIYHGTYKMMKILKEGDEDAGNRE